MKDFLLFAGSSNLPLAREVAKLLNISLGKVDLVRFIDNECRVFVKEPVEGKMAFVLQSLSEVADQHLVELCLLATALTNLRASSVTAVIPWMGYSKQDRAFRKGEAVSAQLVAKIIEVAGFDRVITCELHSKKVLPYFRIPVVELSTQNLLVRTIQKNSNLSTVVVSPDKGGASRSETFAKYIGIPIVYLSKTRDLVSGEVTVTGISDSVNGKDCIIFDDIINTGATAIKTSEFLKRHGAKNIFLLATHGVLAGDAKKKLESACIDEIVITDTIHVPKDKLFPKLRIVSVASILADAISSIVR